MAGAGAAMTDKHDIYIQEVKRRMLAGRIPLERGRQLMINAGCVEVSDGTLLPPGTVAVKHTEDGKVDAEYYQRLAARFTQQSGRPYTVLLAVTFEARIGKPYDEWTDADMDRLVEQTMPGLRGKSEDELKRLDAEMDAKYRDTKEDNE
jgi:hypothetical protein